MFDMTGDISRAMSVILSFTDRIGMFGMAITGWIFFTIAFDWSVSLLQRIGKALIPGVTYEQERSQEIQDAYDFNIERDDMLAENERRGFYDPESE